jgi:hypothetical protein
MRIDRRPSPNQLVLWPRHTLTPVIGTPHRQALALGQPHPKPAHMTHRSTGRKTSGPSQTQPDLTRPNQQVRGRDTRSTGRPKPGGFICT